MKYKIIWSGLADATYYKVIAQYCLLSWAKLPGEKNIIHDSNLIKIKGISITPWEIVPNNNSKFLELSPNKKPWGFWRKMQSQVYAYKKFKNNYDFIVLLDTDIEVLDFEIDAFEAMLTDFKESNHIWATGQSNRRGHDSGFIILNTAHPRLKELIEYYENIWESGAILNLEKPYDGHAVESMFEIYPSFKIGNIDYGSGFHVYDLGFVHYGSKIPKALRQEFNGTGQEIVEHYTKDRVPKKVKYLDQWTKKLNYFQ